MFILLFLLIIIIYLLPIIIAARIGKETIIKMYEISKAVENAPPENKAEAANKYAKENRVFKEPSPSIEELKKEKKFFIYKFAWIIRKLHIFFFLPIAALRIALMFKYGIKITWRMPFHLYELWPILFIILSYIFSTIGQSILGFILAVFLITIMIYGICSYFKTENGRPILLSTPIHKISISYLLVEGFIIVFAFAALHYCVSCSNSHSYTEELGLLSSLYFSVATASTVGFGDISPITNGARLITLIEMILGIIYFVVVISFFIGIWISRFGTTLKDE